MVKLKLLIINQILDIIGEERRFDFCIVLLILKLFEKRGPLSI
jgi:hypothetical protein